MKTSLLACLFAVALVACSPDSGNTPKIAESQRDALEKAQGLEATVQQNAEDEREKIDEQTE